MCIRDRKKSIFALEGTEILIQRDKEVQMAAHEYGKGRGVYISGLPYSFVNNSVLSRAILWAAHDEADLHKWFSTNYNVEVHAYVKNGKYCVVNNTYEPQDTTVDVYKRQDHYHNNKLTVQEKRLSLCGCIADVVQVQSGVSRLVIFSQFCSIGQ